MYFQPNYCNSVIKMIEINIYELKAQIMKIREIRKIYIFYDKVIKIANILTLIIECCLCIALNIINSNNLSIGCVWSEKY